MMSKLEMWLAEKPKKRWVLSAGYIESELKYTVSIWEPGRYAATGKGPTLESASEDALRAEGDWRPFNDDEVR